MLTGGSYAEPTAALVEGQVVPECAVIKRKLPIRFVMKMLLERLIV